MGRTRSDVDDRLAHKASRLVFEIQLQRGYMAYTHVQKLRKMRAKNKGWNRRLAADLRRIAAWLEKKGPDEFSRSEIKYLQALRGMLDQRLYMNALAKSLNDFLVSPEQYKTRAGGYSIELKKSEL
jgi:hypothetical protein